MNLHNLEECCCSECCVKRLQCKFINSIINNKDVLEFGFKINESTNNIMLVVIIQQNYSYTTNSCLVLNFVPRKFFKLNKDLLANPQEMFEVIEKVLPLL